MKHFLLLLSILLSIALAPARAAVIYSNLKDIGIPTNFVGVYLDVDTGATGTNDDSPPAGWDINAFFGGVGVANSPSFQPARIGAGISDAILGLAVGATIDATRLFPTSYGGSETHLAPQFIAGQEGYLGFKFTTNAPTSAGPYFGWMRVVFTTNAAGAVIQDWAYENSGSAIVAGRVRQSAPAAGAQLVTLSPAGSESFTLDSARTNTGGNANSVLKTGAGTVTLNTANTYSGSTTINGGVLSIGTSNHLGIGSATNTIAISNGTLRNTGVGVNLGANRALTIGAGGATIEVTAGSDLTLAGAISASGIALTKTGPGTLTLNTPLRNGTATLNATAGTTNLRANQTLTSLVIGGSAVVTLSQPGQASEFGDEGGAAAFATDDIGSDAVVLSGNGRQSVPEPGSAALLLSGFAMILGLRVRIGP